MRNRQHPTWLFLTLPLCLGPACALQHGTPPRTSPRHPIQLNVQRIETRASSSTDVLRYVDITPAAHDAPLDEAVTVQIRNTTDIELCISPEQWPMASGNLRGKSGLAVLVVNARSFPSPSHVSGMCWGGGCFIRLSPGESITGVIPYDVFGLPPRLRNNAKTLTYDIIATTCDSADRYNAERPLKFPGDAN